jgi:hypothetical protein
LASETLQGVLGIVGGESVVKLVVDFMDDYPPERDDE